MSIICTDCCPNSQGWFIDLTGCVERCDDCQKFPDDAAATAFVLANVNHCADCGALFADAGGRAVNTRDILSPALCSACTCDPMEG